MIFLSPYDWKATVVPDCGANLLRLQWRGRDLLRTTDDLSALRQHPDCYGLPVLFPPSRIQDGDFTVDGQRYHLPINDAGRHNHLNGIVNSKVWEVVEQAADRLVMQWHYDARALEFPGFPLPFILTIEYRFHPQRLEQTLTIRNDSPAELPAAAGFHTLFWQPRRFRLQAADYRWEIHPVNALATGRRLPWKSDFDPRQWFSPDQAKISGQCPAPAGPHAAELDYGEFTLRYETDPKFRHWCLWNNNPQSGFIAIEPISCLSNGFNLQMPREQTGFFTLPPGQCCTFASRLMIMKSEDVL